MRKLNKKGAKKSTKKKGVKIPASIEKLQNIPLKQIKELKAGQLDEFSESDNSGDDDDNDDENENNQAYEDDYVEDKNDDNC